jgi:hypothetical protein
MIYPLLGILYDDIWIMSTADLADDPSKRSSALFVVDEILLQHLDLSLALIF